MNFAQLKRRVERGETLVEGRVRQTGECQARLRRDWRQAWTPLRIVLAGLGTGFITGRAEPEKALKKLGDISGPRTLQLVSSVAGLVGSVQAAMAAMTASAAADSAEQTAEAATESAAPASKGGPDRMPPQAHRRPDQSWDRQPSPAEAATDVSER